MWRKGAPMSKPVAQHSYTAVLQREGDGYVALCPELDVASQGQTGDWRSPT